MFSNSTNSDEVESGGFQPSEVGAEPSSDGSEYKTHVVEVSHKMDNQADAAPSKVRSLIIIVANLIGARMDAVTGVQQGNINQFSGSQNWGCNNMMNPPMMHASGAAVAGQPFVADMGPVSAAEVDAYCHMYSRIQLLRAS